MSRHFGYVPSTDVFLGNVEELFLLCCLPESLLPILPLLLGFGLHLEKSCIKALSFCRQACLQKCSCPPSSDGDNHSLFLRDGPVVIGAQTLCGIWATKAGVLLILPEPSPSSENIETPLKLFRLTPSWNALFSPGYWYSHGHIARVYNLGPGWASAIFLQNPGSRMHLKPA